MAPRARSLSASVALLAALALGAAPLPAAAQAPGNGTPGAPATTAPPAPRLTTPVFSARRVPTLLQAHIADQRLEASVAEVMAKAPPTSCAVVTDRGRPIARTNADAPLAPASTMKLLTGTAVLQKMAPGDRLATIASAQRRPDNGVVDGNLWIIGGGDALLTTPGYKQAFSDQEQRWNDYARLADNIRNAGVTEIRGDIVGDDARYDAERYVATWPTKYQKQDTVGPLSALIVNDGVTNYSTSPDEPSKTRKPGDPPVLAAETLKTLLEQRGVRVGGAPIAGRAPQGLTEVARLDSLPIADMVAEMLTDSDNTTAELLTKELGVVTARRGTTADGLAATQSVLTELGAPMGSVVLRDGSGLDEGNRVTCDLLAAALDRQGPDSVLAKGLAVAAQSGTLRKRMRNTPLAGKVVAKTGTLNTVAGLAGFVTTRAGGVITFAFVQNGPTVNEMLQDELALAILDYPQAPPVETLGPKPVATT